MSTLVTVVDVNGVAIDSFTLESEDCTIETVQKELASRGYENTAVTLDPKGGFHANLISLGSTTDDLGGVDTGTIPQRFQSIPLENYPVEEEQISGENNGDEANAGSKDGQETFDVTDDFTDELLSASQDLFSNAFMSSSYHVSSTASTSPSSKSKVVNDFAFSNTLPFFSAEELDNRFGHMQSVCFQIQEYYLLCKNITPELRNSNGEFWQSNFYMSVYDEIEYIMIVDLEGLTGSRGTFELRSSISTHGPRVFRTNEVDKTKFIKYLKSSQQNLRRQKIEKQLSEQNPLTELMNAIAWQEEQIILLNDTLQEKWKIKEDFEKKIDNMSKTLQNFLLTVSSANDRQKSMMTTLESMRKGKSLMMERCTKTMGKVEEIGTYITTKEHVIQNLDQQLGRIQKRERWAAIWTFILRGLFVGYVLFRFTRWCIRVVIAMKHVTL